MRLPRSKNKRPMAKRKSRRQKPTKKAPPKLDVSFQCPFCDHPAAADCSLDFKLKIGEAICRVCCESYATTINFLSEPIDMQVSCALCQFII